MQELEGTWLAQGGNAKSGHSLQQRVQQQMISTLKYKFALKYNDNRKLLLLNLVINLKKKQSVFTMFTAPSAERTPTMGNDFSFAT